jgi:hypothetical protein
MASFKIRYKNIYGYGICIKWQFIQLSKLKDDILGIISNDIFFTSYVCCSLFTSVKFYASGY